MRFVAFVALLLSAVGFAAAQLPPGTPQCAIPCLVKGATQSPCGLNKTCLCAEEQYKQSVETCVRSSCFIEDVLVAKNTSDTACGVEPRYIGAMHTETSHILTSIGVALVIIRVVYRQWITQLGLGADDWTIIFVAVTCIPSTVLNAKLEEDGIGRDIWTVTPHQITQFGLHFWIMTLIYFTDMALLKLSILFFFLRIFPERNFRRVVWVTIGVVCAYGVAFVVAAAFQCWPFSFNWNQWNDRGSGGRCVDRAALAWSNAAASIVLDLWILYLPFSQILSLNLHWKKKLGIAAMFVVGTFVTVISIIRLASLIEFRKSDNVTRDYTGITTWSTVELGTGVLCACMPTMRLILVRFWPNVFGSTMSTSYDNQYNRYGRSTGQGNNTNKTTGNRLSTFGRSGVPSSLSGKQGGNGFMDAVAYPSSSRMQRIDSDDEEIQLRNATRLPGGSDGAYLARASSSTDSDGDKRTLSLKGITVTTEVETKFHEGRGRGT
ncbi:hypothetical protein Micbo1qcDRAFT_198842 [Microdochium bolleyi]|uniref:CFEM domain-containing protein n=1 Tax=Microdochium bolleyi TaxID=196109 RepID=A0A136IKN1_9PEZI|nr:hypothetical protein Micbo1qcDRAFT_198842 [Microdochium bolleyi]